MSRIQEHLHDHVIVAGFGTSGEETVRELIRRGFPPKQIVVIDVRPTALEEAEGLGVAVLEGDATRNATLEAVKIGRARCMAVSAGRDDTSILIVLTARGMAPQVAISVVVKAEDNEELARQAGATTVINPASFAGLLLAGSAHGPHIAEYMADLAATDGKVALHRAQGHRRRGRPAALGDRHRPRRADLPRRQVLRLLGASNRRRCSPATPSSRSCRGRAAPPDGGSDPRRQRQAVGLHPRQRWRRRRARRPGSGRRTGRGRRSRPAPAPPRPGAGRRASSGTSLSAVVRSCRSASPLAR